MLASSKIPLPDLIELCRTLRHNLDAGLPLTKVFRQQAQKGPRSVRPVAERIVAALERGDALESALEREEAAFPPLLLALVKIGEQSGNLPEVFAALEKYYRSQQRLWRHFISQSIMPCVQLVAAIFVIAAMILILGWIAESRNAEPLDPLGLGLVGPSGAMIFLLVAFGSIGALVGGYFIASRSLRHKAAVDGFLLRVPVIGPCLRALALARFSMALQLMLETALATPRALRLSLRATGNAAFAARADDIARTAGKGNELALALARTGLFGENFCNVVAVAEEGGRLPEVLKQQWRFYEEESERRLTLLTRAAAFGVWLFVAILIVIAIFRIFTKVYLGAIEQFGG